MALQTFAIPRNISAHSRHRHCRSELITRDIRHTRGIRHCRSLSRKKLINYMTNHHITAVPNPPPHITAVANHDMTLHHKHLFASFTASTARMSPPPQQAVAGKKNLLRKVCPHWQPFDTVLRNCVDAPTAVITRPCRNCVHAATAPMPQLRYCRANLNSISWIVLGETEGCLTMSLKEQTASLSQI